MGKGRDAGSNVMTAEHAYPSKLGSPRKFKKQLWKDNTALFILVIPAVLYFIIFHYLPMLGVVLAFKDYRYDLGIFGSAWSGFSNFEFFIRSQDAGRVLRNTVGYGFIFIVVNTALATGIALLLFEIKNKLALKYYQTTLILPRFLSWIIVGYLTYALLSPTYGVLNQILQIVGVEPIEWYTNVKYWPFILTLSEAWKSVGIGSIIYYAGLMGLDAEMYEAAKIDGAGRWRQMWSISIPSLVPLMTIMVLLSLGNIFRGDFGLFYQIPRDIGLLYPATDIIDTYVYRGLRSGDIGMSTAVGLFQSVAGLILLLTVNGIIRKVRPENALF